MPASLRALVTYESADVKRQVLEPSWRPQAPPRTHKWLCILSRTTRVVLVPAGAARSNRPPSEPRADRQGALGGARSLPLRASTVLVGIVRAARAGTNTVPAGELRACVLIRAVGLLAVPSFAFRSELRASVR
jgi:hypothetical protein